MLLKKCTTITLIVWSDQKLRNYCVEAFEALGDYDIPKDPELFPLIPL